MKELLFAIVEGLITDKSAIQITEDEVNEEGVTVLHLNVAPDDMGRVIGKQGRIAKAIRTLMRAAAARENKKVAVEID
ncbi:MAG: KH domain-containing protein [Oscillospiraceae bacterium]|nr:KH domain-containing protein [Oscillospiraceae bacterium]